MTLNEFKRLLASHGPAVDDWPACVVEDGIDLLAVSAEAQRLFVEVSLGPARDDEAPPHEGPRFSPSRH